MKKNTNRQSRTRLQSLDTAQLAQVTGGTALWQPGVNLLIMGGCFPPMPYPEPYPLPSPYPIPVW